MAICVDCNQEMMSADGCIEVWVNINNKNMLRLPYGRDLRAPDLAHDKPRCHDCNVTWGHLHHPGCDMEECPNCHGQLISCNCIVMDVKSADPEWYNADDDNSERQLGIFGSL